MVDSCFPQKHQHDWSYVYVCISYRKLYACIRIILHSFKVSYYKSVKQKKMTYCTGTHAMDRWSLPAVHLIYLSSVEHWHWIHQTVRIPCLTLVDPNRKEPDLYFKVVDRKLQVADRKAEVGELRSGGIPQFNPWFLVKLALHWLPMKHCYYYFVSAQKILGKQLLRPQHWILPAPLNKDNASYYMTDTILRLCGNALSY